MILPHAHGAGFTRGVKGGALQLLKSMVGQESSDGDYLGMGSWILLLIPKIAAAGQHGAVAYDDGAERVRVIARAASSRAMRMKPSSASVAVASMLLRKPGVAIGSAMAPTAPTIRCRRLTP